MAAGASYPVQIQAGDAHGVVVYVGELTFTDSADQPTSPNPITSGALPQTSAWVSGTAKQPSTARGVTLAFDVVTDGTANAATCVIALSPDGTTYTTVANAGASAAVNTTGAVTLPATVTVPAGWFVKLTFAHCTPSVGTYW